MIKLIMFAVVSVGLSAQAQTQQGAIPVQVNPVGPVEMSNIAIPGQTSRNVDRAFVVNVRNTCFGTNLRAVQNPLGPASRIRISFRLTPSTSGTVAVNYDGAVATSGTVSGSTGTPTQNNFPPNTRGSHLGNIVRIEVPVTVSSTINSDGEVIESAVPRISDVSFYQIVPGNAQMRQYMARTGPLASTVHVYQPAGSYSAEIHAAFPGQEGYCGGYHSPLMVFFDDARPAYTGESIIRNGAKKTAWPEKGSPGYFIALDGNKDKKIASVDELFGADGDQIKNGFEKLKKHDSNKDGVIDAKDKDFSKLVLFRDWNGKQELIKLSDRIQSIDLKYNFDSFNAYSDRAESRERSKFKGKEGKEGVVEDLWFKPLEI